MMRYCVLLLVFCQPIAPVVAQGDVPLDSTGLVLLGRIGGNIAPKSIIYAGNGRFFAQNMMYRHSVTVYDRNRKLLATIPDRIPGEMLDSALGGVTLRGAPVEAAASHGGRSVWVTNYLMSGPGFTNPGNDTCEGDIRPFDESLLYRIDADRLKIVNVVRVGQVPKVVAVTPDDRLALVSNWCGGDISVVDLEQEREIRRIPVGRYPRGIAVSRSSRFACIAVMGSYDVAVLDLGGYRLSWLRGVGRSPRHLVLDASDRSLYVSLNGDGTVAKVDLTTRNVVARVATGTAPRSMALSADGKVLYVANYESNTLSKIRTEDFTVVGTVGTDHHPIGIAIDPESNRVWVACYSGSIMVFQDQQYSGSVL